MNRRRTISGAKTAAVLMLVLAMLAGCASQTVEVYDGANFISITPVSGLPVSDLTEDSFIADQNGLPVYKGGDYTLERGIDVSEFQGDIDWTAVAESGISFVFLRCGYRGASEGNLSADAAFATNFEEASAAGLTVGVYFYSQAITVEEAREEAEFVKGMLTDRKPDLPVIFDWERNDTVEGSRTYSADGEVITDCAVAFCSDLEASGYDAGVYMNLDTGYHTWDLGKLSDYAFWVSDPGVYPRFYYYAEYWQYSFTGTVPGIEGNCDLDYRFYR